MPVHELVKINYSKSLTCPNGASGADDRWTVRQNRQWSILSGSHKVKFSFKLKMHKMQHARFFIIGIF